MKLCHFQWCRIQPASCLLSKRYAGMNSNELTSWVTKEPRNRWWWIVLYFIKETIVNCYQSQGTMLIIIVITLEGVWWQISQTKHPKTPFQEGISGLNYPIITDQIEKHLRFGKCDHVFKLFWKLCGLEVNNVFFLFYCLNKQTFINLLCFYCTNQYFHKWIILAVFSPWASEMTEFGKEHFIWQC